jgi:hypothetical protein
MRTILTWSGHDWAVEVSIGGRVVATVPLAEWRELDATQQCILDAIEAGAAAEDMLRPDQVRPE